MENEKAQITVDDCTGCSTCIDVCPANAISMRKFERIE
jgi:Pyruvate/2-oxoacid:ferredoxin oxidoreductase delta subunit